MQTAGIANGMYVHNICMNDCVLSVSVHIQHLSTCLVVHLNPTISCLLLAFPVAIEPVVSVNANYILSLAIATIEELLVYSAKVN